MNWWIWVIIIGVIVLLVALIFLLRWWIKRKKIMKYSDIPDEVMEDFEIAERRLKENKDGKTTPHKILWDIARGREQRNRETYNPGVNAEVGGRDAEVGGREQAISSAELPAEPEGRDTVQSRTPETVRTVKRKPKRNWA